jgi:hypothetical protein
LMTTDDDTIIYLALQKNLHHAEAVALTSPHLTLRSLEAFVAR